MVTALTQTQAFALQPSVLWQSANVTLKVFRGEEARQYLPQIAKLRIDMFREFPYLYEGSLDYETHYLETYFRSENSAILLVFDGETVVGFSNSIPVAEELEEIRLAFQTKHIDFQKYLYIGEVMIQPAYRGKGLLRKFFEYHESRAKELSYDQIVFMTVNRPSDHPLRPGNYTPLEPIWEHFGYHLLPEVTIKLSWKQVDSSGDVENCLGVWKKAIKPVLKTYGSVSRSEKSIIL